MSAERGMDKDVVCVYIYSVFVCVYIYIVFVCVCSVIELCPTLCNPMNCSQPGNGTPLQDSCLENPMDGGA